MARDAGLRHRSGTLVPKATIHRILTNPLYAGDIVWDGQRYRGRHEPVISREVFDRVQNVLQGKPGKHRQTKRDFAFAGLLTCGHCGCSLTAEMKKGRYVYHHCTGYRGKCGEPYVREEILEDRFTELLRLLKIEPDILDWIGDSLRHSRGETRRIHEQAIKRLRAEDDKLQRRLDAMYIDNLDGRVDTETFDRLAEQWQVEQERIRRSIDKHREANETYFAEGSKILELASQSQELFVKQPPQEKRKLLDFLLRTAHGATASSHQHSDNPLICS